MTSESASEDTGPTTDAERDADEITQEEKPRSRILAEYLAQGYVVGDAAIQRAIELDQKHGVTNRFVTTLQGLDAKYHAADRAKAADQSYKITEKATSLFGGLSSYFEKAVRPSHPLVIPEIFQLTCYTSSPTPLLARSWSVSTRRGRARFRTSTPRPVDWRSSRRTSTAAVLIRRRALSASLARPPRPHNLRPVSTLYALRHVDRGHNPLVESEKGLLTRWFSLDLGFWNSGPRSSGRHDRV